MKDYKISIFDDKEFYLTYKSSVIEKIKGDVEIIDNHYALFNNAIISQLNKLIFDVYSFEPSEFILLSTYEDLVSQMMIEDEILNDPNEPAENYDDIYITDNGILCSGRCVDFTASCMPDKERKEFKYKKYNQEYSIVLDKQKENLYLRLNNIGLTIIGISGDLYCSLEDGQEPDENTYTNYLVKYSKADRENFISLSTGYLEKQIKERIKGPTIKKLKDNLLQDISRLNDEYGTKGKNIYLKDVDKDVLLLLHIEEKIQILDFNSKNEFYINIEKEIEKNESKEEVEKDDYYSKYVKPPIIENKEYEPILIYENLQLKSKDGKKNITIRNKQKLLCDLIFSTGYLKNNTYTFSDIEDNVYDRKTQNIEAIKSLIKNLKGKLNTLGYKNIIEYTNEILIVKAIM